MNGEAVGERMVLWGVYRDTGAPVRCASDPVAGRLRRNLEHRKAERDSDGRQRWAGLMLLPDGEPYPVEELERARLELGLEAQDAAGEAHGCNVCQQEERTPGGRWLSDAVRACAGCAGRHDGLEELEVPAEVTARLEEIRAALRAECVSYGELAELASLAQYIDAGDVELLEPAGVPESAAYVTRAERARLLEAAGGEWPEET